MSLPNLLGLWAGFETNSTRGPTDQVLSPEDGGGANFERLWFIKTPKQWISPKSNFTQYVAPSSETVTLKFIIHRRL